MPPPVVVQEPPAAKAAREQDRSSWRGRILRAGLVSAPIALLSQWLVDASGLRERWIVPALFVGTLLVIWAMGYAAMSIPSRLVLDDRGIRTNTGDAVAWSDVRNWHVQPHPRNLELLVVRFQLRRGRSRTLTLHASHDQTVIEGLIGRYAGR